MSRCHFLLLSDSVLFNKKKVSPTANSSQYDLWIIFSKRVMISGKKIEVEFFQMHFLALLGPQAECHLFLVFLREGITKTQQLTPKQSSWINRTTGKRKIKYVFLILG